ncbi:hypothetical protein HUJ05_006960 [Dendroctonus ponderosae]|nr:hypothetical protein HUJ05_006960 [Dendroctonus ponderosae]
MCEQLGVGFAAQTELTSFQAFFVEVLAPHSIKKGENFNLLVHVSNYVNYSFPIKISIRLSDNLVLKHQMAATYCLQENRTQTHNYPIEAAGIGAANLTVLVESESQFPFACGPETIVSKRDVVFKSFQVEPEGYYMADTQSAFLCASKPHFQSNVSWTVSVPTGVVAGTQKVALALSADLLTQSIQCEKPKKRPLNVSQYVQ